MSRTYEQLEPVISALDERIKTNLGAFPTDTASGAVASFADGADDIPLKSLVVDINPVQDLSQGDPSPENICPISGWTGANVTRCGKNLFDKTATDTDNGYVNGKYIGSNGGVSPSSSYNVSEYVAIKANTTYTLSGISGANPSLVFYDSEKQYISGIKYNQYESLTFVTPDNAEYVRMTIPVANADVFQLEVGSTATDYEPYNGQTIPIDWQTEAGTVYGGHLDVLSGVLTVDRAMVDMGTLNWTYDAPVFYTTDLVNSIKQPLVNTTPFLCSNYNAYPSASRATMKSTVPNGSFTITSSGNIKNVVVKDSSYTDAATFKTAMSGVQLVYELATPITVQLTPHEVRSLLGQNNIFADTGDSSVEYRADTKMYIKRLTEPDADMIADSNIVSGQYFMVGNSLYLATANIASGSAVIEGTNCTHKSLSEALNEINS